MKKNGFVFVESIVVLVVVALSLSMMISSYSLVSRKTKEKENYNSASDKYLLYSISTVGTDDLCNYSIKCNSEESINFHATKANCADVKLGKIIYECQKVFDEYNISDIYVIDDILKTLTDKNIYSQLKIDNGTVEYMKTLKKCNDESYSANGTCNSSKKYMIGVFKRGSNDYHYASIEL